MKNNIKLAHEYAKNMLGMLKEDGIWVSDNLGYLQRPERKAILKVYKQYYNIVEYNPTTGVCKCTNGPDTVEKDNTGDVYIAGPDTGGEPVKSENMQSILDKSESIILDWNRVLMNRKQTQH